MGFFSSIKKAVRSTLPGGKASNKLVKSLKKYDPLGKKLGLHKIGDKVDRAAGKFVDLHQKVEGKAHGLMAKAISKDPLGKWSMKVDPLARDFVYGPIKQQEEAKAAQHAATLAAMPPAPPAAVAPPPAAPSTPPPPPPAFAPAFGPMVGTGGNLPPTPVGGAAPGGNAAGSMMPFSLPAPVQRPGSYGGPIDPNLMGIPAPGQFPPKR